MSKNCLPGLCKKVRFLLINFALGMIAICNPFTGKVEREAIFCGNTDEREPMEISVMKIDR